MKVRIICQCQSQRWPTVSQPFLSTGLDSDDNKQAEIVSVSSSPNSGRTRPQKLLARPQLFIYQVFAFPFNFTTWHFFRIYQKKQREMLSTLSFASRRSFATVASAVHQRTLKDIPGPSSFPIVGAVPHYLPVFGECLVLIGKFPT